MQNPSGPQIINNNITITNTGENNGKVSYQYMIIQHVIFINAQDPPGPNPPDDPTSCEDIDDCSAAAGAAECRTSQGSSECVCVSKGTYPDCGKKPPTHSTSKLKCHANYPCTK